MLLTIDQAAEQLAVSRRTVFHLIKEGELKAVKIGRSTRIRENDLNVYVTQLKEVENGSNS